MTLRTRSIRSLAEVSQIKDLIRRSMRMRGRGVETPNVTPDLKQRHFAKLSLARQQRPALHFVCADSDEFAEQLFGLAVHFSQMFLNDHEELPSSFEVRQHFLREHTSPWGAWAIGVAIFEWDFAKHFNLDLASLAQDLIVKLTLSDPVLQTQINRDGLQDVLNPEAYKELIAKNLIYGRSVGMVSDAIWQSAQEVYPRIDDLTVTPYDTNDTGFLVAWQIAQRLGEMDAVEFLDLFFLE